MQSSDDEGTSHSQYEEAEEIQDTETPKEEKTPNSSDTNSATECNEVDNTDKCLVTINSDTEFKASVNIQSKYEQRITNLQDLILSVRQKLREEKEWWDTEIAELKMKLLDYSPDCLDYCSSPNSSVATDLHAQLLESPTENSIYNFALDSKESTDYERKLKCYQEALNLAQFEKHQNMKRQLAAHAYKKKLLEIEQLCNVELSRMQQNTCMLEPLNKMAAEWKLSPVGSMSEKTWKVDPFITSHSGKMSANFCDINCTSNDNYSLSTFGDSCKGDMTCLKIVSIQHNGLNDAAVQHEKCCRNPVLSETLNQELPANEFENMEGDNTKEVMHI